MNLDQYRDRNERGRQEQKERDLAIARDSKPYDPKEMKHRMPLPCGIFFLIGIAMVIFMVAVIVRKMFWA